jgi:hypothetical protein
LVDSNQVIFNNGGEVVVIEVKKWDTLCFSSPYRCP